MSDLLFQEEEYQVARKMKVQQKPKSVTWLMIHSGGLLKNEAQAQLVLIVFVILTLAFSFYLLATIGAAEVEVVAPPGRIIEYPEDGPPRLRPM